MLPRKIAPYGNMLTEVSAVNPVGIQWFKWETQNAIAFSNSQSTNNQEAVL